MSFDGFLNKLRNTNFKICQLKDFYVDILRWKKIQEGMRSHLDTDDVKELSKETEYYLNKTELELEMIRIIIKYICIGNKYDFNSIIDSLNSAIDQQDDHHSDDVLSIGSSSSYIVDVTEDESSEEVKVSTFTRDQITKSVFHENLFTCHGCGQCYDVQIQPTAVNCSQQRLSSFRGCRSLIKAEKGSPPRPAREQERRGPSSLPSSIQQSTHHSIGYMQESSHFNRDRRRPNSGSHENYCRPKKEQHRKRTSSFKIKKQKTTSQ